MAKKYDRFKPSNELVELVGNSQKEEVIHPEFLGILKATRDDGVLKKNWRRVIVGRKSVGLKEILTKKYFIKTYRGLIEDKVYSAVIYVAKKASYENGHLRTTGERVSVNGSFVDFFKEILISDFNLEKGMSEKVFELLHDELKVYVETPRRYPWGRMYARKSDLCIDIKKCAFTIPDIDKIPGKHWTKV